jgi:hypothetical protein
MLAMYVVYESPLQMLADSPLNYLGEPEVILLSFATARRVVLDRVRRRYYGAFPVLSI